MLIKLNVLVQREICCDLSSCQIEVSTVFFNHKSTGSFAHTLLTTPLIQHITQWKGLPISLNDTLPHTQ